MPITIQIAPGDWGGASGANLAAVFKSASSTLEHVLDQGESIGITLESTTDPGGIPRALAHRNESGDFVIRVSIRGNSWAQLAFQVGHELCHVLADSETWINDRFSWIEEVLCETASLYTLRKMARTWPMTPPYPNWRDYASRLDDYATKRMEEEKHSLPAGETIQDWLIGRRALLEANLDQRANYVILAKEVLPIFEINPPGWRVIRFLHRFPRAGIATAEEYVDAWHLACPPEIQSVVASTAAIVVHT